MEEQEEMKKVTIYTDGACSGNPGPGGWAAILTHITKDGEYIEKVVSGGKKGTTNNCMELQAVVAAFECLKHPSKVHLVSDSKYVIDGLSKGWAKNWRAHGWVKSDKKTAANKELWERLLELTEKHEVTYEWVRGHAQNAYNNRCDQLAVEESKKYKE